jgi:predicted nucleic acid-binding protein
MMLVDTSVWVEHFRTGSVGLETLLNDGQVTCHPFVIGELACGNLKNRSQILSFLSALPTVHVAEHEEVMHAIEKYHLMGRGLGYIDVHLLASAKLTRTSLWTLDKRLNDISTSLGVSA